MHQSDHQRAHAEEPRCQLQREPEIEPEPEIRPEWIGQLLPCPQARAQREGDVRPALPPIRQRTASLSPHPRDERDQEEYDTSDDWHPKLQAKHSAPPYHLRGPVGSLDG